MEASVKATMKDMKIGDAARVERLELRGKIGRRLQDIGLIEGTRVECMLKSPSGDPTAYLIRGAVIAIRSEDSSKVFVTALIPPKTLETPAT